MNTLPTKVGSMWEFTLCIDGIDSLLAEAEYIKLKSQFALFNGLVSRYGSEKNEYFLFATKTHTNEAKALVLNFICDTINTVWKKKFVSKCLKYNTSSKYKYDSIIQAMVSFDKKSDDEIIAENFQFTNEMNLASFYNFRLRVLRQKWEQLIAITNENIGFLNFDETFLDIVRFLVEGIEVTSEIKVVQKNKDAQIYDINENLIQTITRTTNSKLISYIISKNPKSITLVGVDADLTEYLKNIFYNRIKIENNS